MLIVYAEKWWVTFLRGLIALIIGSMALLRPIQTFNTIVILFAIYLLLDGIITGSLAFFHFRIARRWPTAFLQGLFAVLIGILVLVWPYIAIRVFIFLIAFWAILTGLINIVTGFHMKKYLNGEWLVILIGVLTVLLGIVLIVRPIMAGITLIWLLGLFLIILGISYMILAFRFRKHRNSAEFEMTVTKYRSIM